MVTLLKTRCSLLAHLVDSIEVEVKCGESMARAFLSCAVNAAMPQFSANRGHTRTRLTRRFAAVWTGCRKKRKLRNCVGFIVRREFASHRDPQGWTNLCGFRGPKMPSIRGHSTFSLFTSKCIRWACRWSAIPSGIEQTVRPWLRTLPELLGVVPLGRHRSSRACRGSEISTKIPMRSGGSLPRFIATLSCSDGVTWTS
jgi:hypothetical protein